MILRCLAPLALKFDGQGVYLEPGAVFTVTPAQAERVLARFPGKVEVLTLQPDLPIEPCNLAGEWPIWIVMDGWLEGATIRTTGLCGHATGWLGHGLSPSPMDRPFRYPKSDQSEPSMRQANSMEHGRCASMGSTEKGPEADA